MFNAYKNAIRKDPTIAGEYASLVHTLIVINEMKNARLACEDLDDICPGSLESKICEALLHWAKGRGRGVRSYDHKHRLKTVRTYAYRDAAALLADFWHDVDAVLKEKGIIK